MPELSYEQKTRMEAAVAGLETKSDKIRALHRAGFQRSPIAQFLGIRYQHVRNVLIQALQSRVRQADAAGAVGQPPRYEWAPIGPDGRVVVPAPYRRLLGIEGGGQVLMLLEDGAVRLVGRDAAIRLAQDIVAKYVPKAARLSDELIAERRTEAAREDDDESNGS